MLVVAAVGIASDLWLRAAPKVNPPATAGEWKLSAPAECGAMAPADVRSWRGIAGARRICRAEYAGSPPMRLTLIEMPGDPGATAFDAFQKWGPARQGAECFFRGRYFGVVEAAGAEPAALRRYLDALDHALPGRPGLNTW